MARSTVRVPERIEPGQHVQVVADLHIEVGDDRGRTSAHLLSGQDGLALDVTDPAVLLRSVPGRGLTRDLPVRLPVGLGTVAPVRLRSSGRDLGQVRLTSGGRLRVRPTAAGLVVAGRTVGLVVAGRTVLSGGPARAAAAGLAAVLVAVALTQLHPRRR